LKLRNKKSIEDLKRIADEKAESIGEIIRLGKIKKRKIIFATNASFLVERAKRAYGLRDIDPYILPNPLVMPKWDGIHYSPKPSLCFIGRLDPTKRFWIVFELAKRFKEIDFIICGTPNNVELMDPIINKYKDLPNLKMLGIVDGPKKVEVFRQCWGLINTSIHEGLPVTFLEACSYGKCVISCLDPDHLVTRFGYYTGDILGEGMDESSLNKFSKQIEQLLSNKNERLDKGKKAREHVAKVHSFENFDNHLKQILRSENIN